MKRVYAYLVLLVTAVLIAGFYLFFLSQQSNNTVVIINDKKISVEIAKTSQERSTGLCCRDSLDADSGMLFIFDTTGDYSFWMKDTRIALDMYWINEQKEIVHIEHNVTPDSYPESFGSPVPARFILETNANFAQQYNIKVGDTVEFINIFL